MALVFTGTRTRSKGVISAIQKQFGILNLKPAKRITFKFDPFLENAKEIRNFMHFITDIEVSKSNPFCRFKYDVVNDRSEPTITINLDTGSDVIFKCNHLTTLDMSKLYNKYVTSLVPKEVVEQNVVSTKAGKAKAKAKKH